MPLAHVLPRSRSRPFLCGCSQSQPLLDCPSHRPEPVSGMCHPIPKEWQWPGAGLPAFQLCRCLRKCLFTSHDGIRRAIGDTGHCDGHTHVEHPVGFRSIVAASDTVVEHPCVGPFANGIVVSGRRPVPSDLTADPMGSDSQLWPGDQGWCCGNIVGQAGRRGIPQALALKL